MLEKEIEIINKLGLHARAAAKFVNHTSRYGSKIEVVHGEKHVNGKSIMGVMMLAASQGTKLKFIIDGDDAQDLYDDLSNLINDKFGENE